MSEFTYSKEVVDLKLQAILEKCEDILLVAKEGRDQARLTNGRVTTLEKINENKSGANKILTYITIPIVSLLIGYLSWIGIQISFLTKTLASYEITVQK